VKLLSKKESSSLAECEAVIERGLDTFVEVGNALLCIRKERLYRAEFKTFEEYCRNRWQMTKTHANRLIDSAEVSRNLTPMGVIPDSERVARPLVSLPPAKQREAWTSAVAASPSGKPTAKEVEREVSKIVPMTALPDAPKQERVLYRPEHGLERADHAISILSSIDPQDSQREAAFERVERWIDKNRKRTGRAA
jgi:hypothetical protein